LREALHAAKKACDDKGRNQNEKSQHAARHSQPSPSINSPLITYLETRGLNLPYQFVRDESDVATKRVQ
jgi:hypothetical protein